ncbi:MAG: gamma carbonic anhydrase family protein [Bacillota bacterium]
MQIYAYKDKQPIIDDSCFVAGGARIVGDVILHKNVSVWFNTVIRGDSGQVIVGANTNIQDNCTLHTDKGTPCVLGENITVGHNAVVHACRIADNCLIGMNATILSGAIIGANSIVAAGAVLGERKEVPSGTLYAGVPAKFIRNLTAAEMASLKQAADNYLKYAQGYKK